MRRRTGGVTVPGRAPEYPRTGEGARGRRARGRERLRRQRRRASPDREGLPRRRARGGAPLRARGLRRTNWNLRRYLFMPRLGLRGIQRLTVLDDLVVLSGAGVGGGSLVYANTLYEPLDPFYDDDSGRTSPTGARSSHRTTSARGRCSAQHETPFETPADEIVREVARRMEREDTFERTTVAVDFDLCVRCGGCMVGCRYGAKNTLDRNYLRLAEEGGAVVHAEREATLLQPVDGGWEVETRAPGRVVAQAHGALPRRAGRARSGRPRNGEAPPALRRRRAERRRARALELRGDRRRRGAQRDGRLLAGDRDRLVVPPERRTRASSPCATRRARA